MEAEQRKHPRIDGGRGRRCRSTGGGADRRAEVQSEGRIDGRRSNRRGKSADQRPNRRGKSAERKSEAVQQAGASNRRRGRSSDGWMEAARRRIPGATAAALFSSSLSTLFPSHSLDFACCWDGARPRGRYTRSISPCALPATLFTSARSRFYVRAASASTNRTPRRRLGRVRRRHSHPIRGERDAPVGKTPGRLGDD